MHIVVTGAAGLIGSNLIKALNVKGISNILAVDNLDRTDKFKNLVDCDFEDYLPKDDFRRALVSGSFDGDISAIFHQGACSNTMESDAAYMMDNNYRYSCDLLLYCQQEHIPFIYASSAAVYGESKIFSEERDNERPINIYGYSKFLFDQFVRRRWSDNTAQVVGLRYFNVYGPGEAHKGRMASVIYHLYKQYQQQGRVKLFMGSGSYQNGEQLRDFVSVIDAVRLNLWFLEHHDKSGIFNCGTGRARSFNELALTTINQCRKIEGHRPMTIEKIINEQVLQYIEFPKELSGRYQDYTQAGTDKLLSAGYTTPFLNIEEGIEKYVKWLMKQ